MEDDKTFELLTKMYSEFSSRFDSMEGRFENMEGRFENIEGRFENIEGRLESMENEIKKVQIKLEHNIEPQIKILFEDRNEIHRKLDSIDQKVNGLSKRVDKQDIQISVIKGSKI